MTAEFPTDIGGSFQASRNPTRASRRAICGEMAGLGGEPGTSLQRNPGLEGASKGHLSIGMSLRGLGLFRVTRAGEHVGGRSALALRRDPLTGREHQTDGYLSYRFLRCLAELLEVELPIPDHATLSRRRKKLSDIRFRRLNARRLLRSRGPGLDRAPAAQRPSERRLRTVQRSQRTP